MQAVMPWNGKTIKAKKNHSCKVVSIFGRTTAIAAWCRNGVLVFQWRRNIILESKVILFSWFSQNQVVEACTVLFCKVQSSPKACNKFHIQNLQDMGSNPITSTKMIIRKSVLQLLHIIMKIIRRKWFCSQHQYWTQVSSDFTVCSGLSQLIDAGDALQYFDNFNRKKVVRQVQLLLFFSSVGLEQEFPKL